jgi:NADH-quinone oxidoreductase subunit L
LAIPSVLIGWLTIEPVLFGGWLDDSITVLERNDVVAELGHHFHGATALGLHAVQTLPFWLMMAGFVLATLVYMFRPQVADALSQRLAFLYRLLQNKYYFDEFYQKVFAQGGVSFGRGLWKRADAGLIDGFLVNGSARAVNWVAARVRRWQTGYLYDYAFAMIIGLIAILAAWVVLY